MAVNDSALAIPKDKTAYVDDPKNDTGRLTE